MATTSEIKNGLCIRYKDGIYQVVQFQHVKPGKGPAFVRTKLKNVNTGRVIDNTFASGAKIEPVRVETRNYQYLYKDDMGYVFMNVETYEQVTMEEHYFDNPLLLKEGMEIQILFDAEEEIPLTVEFPASVVMEVTHAEPGEKGNTASSTATKLIQTETGLELQAPLFISEGDKIKVDTKTASYSERVKE